MHQFEMALCSGQVKRSTVECSPRFKVAAELEKDLRSTELTELKRKSIQFIAERQYRSIHALKL